MTKKKEVAVKKTLASLAELAASGSVSISALLLQLHNLGLGTKGTCLLKFAIVPESAPMVLQHLCDVAYDYNRDKKNRAIKDVHVNQACTSALFTQIKDLSATATLSITVTDPMRAAGTTAHVTSFAAALRFCADAAAKSKVPVDAVYLPVSLLELRLLKELVDRNGDDLTNFTLYGGDADVSPWVESYVESSLYSLEDKLDTISYSLPNCQELYEMNCPAPDGMGVDTLMIDGRVPSIADDGDLEIGCVTVPYKAVKLMYDECTKAKEEYEAAKAKKVATKKAVKKKVVSNN
jgi:hypothetical protein